MKTESLFLLLIVAAAVAVGWLIGKYTRVKQRKNPEDRFRGHYFRGLNYLLNEQQDKAIDVFLRLYSILSPSFFNLSAITQRLHPKCSAIFS